VALLGRTRSRFSGEQLSRVTFLSLEEQLTSFNTAELFLGAAASLVFLRQQYFYFLHLVASFRTTERCNPYYWASVGRKDIAGLQSDPSR
jgi:hypothetical protein